MGKPKDMDDYDKYEVNDMEVYIRCDIEAKNNELKIKYSKILFTEKLIVEGMIY